MKYELLSLFSGAGGLDRGFSLAGFKSVLALDSSADAVETYNRNAKDAIAAQVDIAELTPEAFLKMIPSDTHPIGIIGGPPCQGFSRANVCADPADPRNLLPFRYADLLAAANERYSLHFFVFENVAGLATPKHADRLAKIIERFCAAGFDVWSGQLNASDFSVPQRRRRLFLVGMNSNLYGGSRFEFPSNTGSLRTVQDAIGGLPHPSYFNRTLTPETIPYHPNHWTMVPKSKKFTSNSASDGRSFKRLKWEEVSPTVAYGHREVHVHPDGGRRLSVLEAMLLQGFPLDYTLTGSLSSQITQVSNAVPPPLAEAIARKIKTILKKRRIGFRKSRRVRTGVDT